MDWHDYPEEALLAALDYAQPRLTAAVSERLADWPGCRGFIAARLQELATKGTVAFTITPHPGWIRVPTFLVTGDGDGI